MQQRDRDEISTWVDAPPEAVYALVSDVTRTPEHSPEVVRCEWLDGATGPVVGARFLATNSVGRGPDWKNRPVVLVADPGREFALSRTEKFAGTVVWRYRLQPEDGGTRVVQGYEVTHRLTVVGWFIIGTLYRLKERRAGLRANMEASLARVKELVEAEHGARRSTPA